MDTTDRIKKNITSRICYYIFGFCSFFYEGNHCKKAFFHTPVDALTLLTLRMIFSLPFYVGAVILATNKKDNVLLTRRQWLNVIVIGLLGYYLSSFFDFTGLQYISAGLERLILFFIPQFCRADQYYFFRQKITRIQQVALFLTYTGIGLAYFGELKIDTANPNFLWGSFLVFLCSITYAIYIVGSGRVIPLIGATKFTAYAMLAATGAIFIHFMVKGNYQGLNTGAGLWGYGLLLAIIATVIPSFLISNGLKRIGSNNVAIISSIGPVSTIIQAHYILGEKIFVAQIIGTILVIAGVLLIGWKSQTVDG